MMFKKRNAAEPMTDQEAIAATMAKVHDLAKLVEHLNRGVVETAEMASLSGEAVTGMRQELDAMRRRLDKQDSRFSQLKTAY